MTQDRDFWKEDALNSLRQEEDNDNLEFSKYGNDDDSFYAEDGNTEYLVFRTEEYAEDYAIERVTQDLEENAEYFNSDWLMNFVDGEDYFRSVYDEWNTSYAEDIQNERGSTYENRLIDEMVEWGIMEEEEAESDDAESIAEDRIYDFVQELTDDQISQGGNGYDYYESNFGKEEAMKVVMDNNLIDIDEASRDAVNTDGIAHFISSYDGNTIYLENDAVAYRTN